MDDQPREHVIVAPLERMRGSLSGHMARLCALAGTKHELLDEACSETAGCDAVFARWCGFGGRIGGGERPPVASLVSA